MIRVTSWNRCSPRFLRAPTFEWAPVAGATRYRVEVSPREGGAGFRGVVRRPRFDFTPCWEKLPLGEVRWTISALDVRGRVRDAAGLLRFVRADGTFRPRRRHADWRASAERNVAFLLGARAPRLPLAHGEAPPRWACLRNFDPRLPLYAWHCCFMDGKFPKEVAFPAMHYPAFIRLFLDYARQGANPRFRGESARQARLFGRLLRRFSWPRGWRCAGLPCSSIGLGKLGASTEGRNYSITRAATAADALLRLAAETGEGAFAAHALHVGEVLRRFQRRDGGFPMRVEPRSGRVTGDYTSNAIAPACLFDRLAGHDLANAPRWLRARDLAIGWVLGNPVRTRRWDGLFEDVGFMEPYANLSNMEALLTVRYLASHSGEDASFVRAAEEVHEWVEDQFVVFGRDDFQKNDPPVPSVFEQFYCPYPMEAHTANWLDTLVILHGVTRKPAYRGRALAAADAITGFQAADGRFHTFAPDRALGRPVVAEDWFACNAMAALSLFRLAREGGMRRGGPG